MRKGKVRAVISWAAVLIWMVVIFLFSAQNGAQSGDLSGSLLEKILAFFHFSTEQTDFWEMILRKGAHFGVYFILAILLAVAFRASGVSLRKGIGLALLLSAAYAVTDEVHQYFVPGRAMRAFDVFIDTCGAATGLLLYLAARFGIHGVRQRRRANQHMKTGE
ncbi:VanZ family protein [Bianquea renquensis]|uniref:VanZ family protein n=1 Tax=Bianquea renquensis TaxID=2763661 RepID=A0A926DVH8_9FIRM|nr:VanZ family protein [Bianquea renquensis]MBC8544602.1 VanZ family protein [Bianquea renquensis]